MNNDDASQNPKVKKSFSEIIKDSFRELKETSIAFVKAPKALWGINLPYILEGLVYFGILTILGKYCSENVGLTDEQAGLVYSFVTGGITFSMLLLGGFSDKLGVRTSLVVSFLVFLIGRLLIAFSGSLGLSSGLWSPMFFLLTSGLLLMVISYGLYQPAAYAGVKRYTTPKTAAMGYAVIYSFMNLGAFFSGFISSFTRQSFETTFPPNGLTAVFWAYVIITFIALVFTVILLSKKNDKEALAQVKAEGNTENEEDEDAVKKPRVQNMKLIFFSILTLGFFLFSDLAFGFLFDSSFSFSIGETTFTIDLFLILAALFFILSIAEYLNKRPEHPFRDLRFTYFIFILIPVQTLFAHNWLTVPYYLDRAFAGTFVSEYFEVFSNINPMLIFILAPLVAGLTARADVYKMMIYGTVVMAVPTFLLVLGPNIGLFLLYVLLMTIGEAMWQPRFLQWIAEVAPKGMTGLYMGVGQFPWFLTKVITGFYSGWFLSEYVPLGISPDQMNTETMWLIYGFIALISPVGLILAKKWMMVNFKTKA